jgi:hypothetical protein
LIWGRAVLRFYLFACQVGNKKTLPTLHGCFEILSFCLSGGQQKDVAHPTWLSGGQQKDVAHPTWLSGGQQKDVAHPTWLHIF